MKSLAAVLAAMVLALPVHAADPPPVESFFQDAALPSMQLSPSGRWLLARAGGGGMSKRLLAIDVENKEPTLVIAAFATVEITWAQWVNDDWLIFRVATPDDQSGKRFGPGLYSVRRDGKELRVLIKRRWDQDLQGRDSRALDPSYRFLALGAPGSTEIIVGETNWDNRGDPTHEFPKLLDVASGATRTLTMPKPPSDAGTWWFDHRGRARVVATFTDGVTRIHWLDAKGEAWKLIAEYPALEGAIWPRHVDADDNLYVVAQDPASGEERLHRFDFANGKIDPNPIVATPGFDASVSILTERATGAVTGLGLLTEMRSTYWLTPAMQQIQAQVDAALPGRVNLLSCRPCDQPKVVLVESYNDRDPGQFLLIRPDARQPMQRLGAVRPDIEPARMARMQFQRIKARDGLSLPMWITALPQDKPAPRPAVVLVHGGPWTRGTEWDWHEEAQFLASRGYVVIEPEFRGSTGFGTAHYRAGWKQWGQAMQDDVTDALRHAVDRGLVDARRVCIAGASYGGYSALMGLVRDPGQYRCAVSWVGVTDPRLMYEVPWSDTSVYSKLFTMPKAVGDPKADAAMLAANAPVEQAAKIKVPVLLAYGAKDLRVPFVHGEKMRDALAAAGNPPEWIVYDNEGHGWERPANRFDFWRRVEAFLAKHLSDKSP